MDDAEVFDAFYRASQPRILHYLYAMTGDRAEAQDVAQEAYARAWQHWPRVARYEAREAWLRTVAWRIATNRWRRARNRLVAHVRHGPTADVSEPSVDNVAVVTALRRLPAAQKQVIVLHHLVGLSVEEIARETGTATGTVKSRLARGRAALSQLLADHGDVPVEGSRA